MDLHSVTQKAQAKAKQLHTEQFALRDKVAARLAVLTADDRLKLMVSAGILNRQGKLTASYRPKVKAA